jgi:uncharacterized protein (DUF983 family)
MPELNHVNPVHPVKDRPVMKRDSRTIGLTLWRSLKLQCPACGEASVFGRPFNVKKHCTRCGVIFQREEGFFVGAIMANVVATEVLILIIYLLCVLLTNLDEQKMLTVLFVLGIAFPLTFYHHSWSLWLGLDHLIEGLPGGKYWER